MIMEKDNTGETQRDISYINEMRSRTKRSVNEVFSNRQINQSILMNENDMSLMNKVKEKFILNKFS